MRWLNDIVEQLISSHPNEEIVVSSGVSPSGTYHIGTLREVLTAEVIVRELKLRGKEARHIHVSDDLDIFRKVPVDVPKEFEKFLGMPLCDVPSPNPSVAESYADFFIADLLSASKNMKLDMEVLRAHEWYREGKFTDAIEKSLENVDYICEAIESISGRKLDPQWSPVQVLYEGRLKNKKVVDVDTENKTISSEIKDGEIVEFRYDNGDTKLNWRIDWPARWWILGVDAEPFGRDHATKGGSYDTGVAIVRDVFGVEPPLPIPYNFINKTGETKKMSKSKGDAVIASDLLEVLPVELVWFFMLRNAPEKQLFFDTEETLIRLFDEFSEMISKENKTGQEEQLIKLCLHGINEQTVSGVPFTLLFNSYQASLQDESKAIDLIKLTEYKQIATEQESVILKELKYIDNWLTKWAPEDVKFSLRERAIEESEFTEVQEKFLLQLADRLEQAPEDADGEWFHKAIYDFKESLNLQPKDLFTTIYKILIDKESGPRAGWFLSILPREWLIKQLRSVT